jgi:methionyl aminopeptidase
MLMSVGLASDLTMSIQSERELELLRIVGRIVRLALKAMAEAVAPGVTTAELDAICARVLAEHGAASAPKLVYGFPGTSCISVNDEVVHGIPRNRVVRDGDLVKLDVTAEKDGFFADAAMTVRVGEVSATAQSLTRCAEAAFHQAMRVVRAGARVHEIGRVVERTVRSNGFSVVRELCGHGVGRTIHEEPTVPNYFDPRNRTRLTEGLVIAVEPIIAAGGGQSVLDADGWTVRTADHSLAAHYEQTVVVTRHGPLLVTA